MPSQASPRSRTSITVRAALEVRFRTSTPRAARSLSLSPSSSQSASVSSGPSTSGCGSRRQSRAPCPTEPRLLSSSARSAAASELPAVKRRKIYIPPGPPPATDTWLRSGRNSAHKSVHESSTIRVCSIAKFKLSPDTSSQTTEPSASEATEPSGHQLDESHQEPCQSSETESSQTTLTEPACSPVARSLCLTGTPIGSAVSQAETVAPWTPQRKNLREIKALYDVPQFLMDVLDSDDYDSDTLAFMEPYRRPLSSLAPSPSTPRPSATRLESGRSGRARALSIETPNHTPQKPASQTLSTTSSPGFMVVQAPPPRDTWASELWPTNVTKLTSSQNPSNWRFRRVSLGTRDGQGCGCLTRCNAFQCRNARQGRFCVASNCSFASVCGNSIHESDALMLARNVRTGVRGVVAKSAIPAGEVIGEYLGVIQLFGPPCSNAPANEGYRMHFATRTTGNKYVGVDALDAGGMTRFLNHSCNATARFHEVHTGDVLTVVAVTVRDVYPGDEVTVDYGDSLWFVCRCGWWGCQHRHLQGMPDIMGTISA